MSQSQRVNQPKQARSLRDKVYDALEEMVIFRVLKPGEHLVEADIAGRLGVSRVPVREALALLSRDGWIELRPRQGAFVHQPTLKEVDEVFAVRTLLEVEAARLAAKNADDAVLAELDELVETGLDALSRGAERDVVQANSAFHRRVAEIAGNDVLAGVIARLDKRIRWYFAPVARLRSDASWKEHATLVEAIRARDPEWAAEVTAMHLDLTKTAYHQQKQEEQHAPIEPVERA